jgi:hypothetical protein
MFNIDKNQSSHLRQVEGAHDVKLLGNSINTLKITQKLLCKLRKDICLEVNRHETKCIKMGRKPNQQKRSCGITVYNKCFYFVLKCIWEQQ